MSFREAVVDLDRKMDLGEHVFEHDVWSLLQFRGDAIVRREISRLLGRLRTPRS